MAEGDGRKEIVNADAPVVIYQKFDVSTLVARKQEHVHHRGGIDNMSG